MGMFKWMAAAAMVSLPTLFLLMLTFYCYNRRHMQSMDRRTTPNRESGGGSEAVATPLDGPSEAKYSADQQKNNRSESIQVEDVEEGTA
mmetsp:Transcript_517/g.888  ORF Transcript_517/g.888 Transcript_517/m.888 type:complete len:89 (+) Transcript_517:72-338(+)